MTQGITRKQAELLNYLRSCETTPSFEEMRAALGLSSKSGVHRLVEALVERGRIRRRYNRARSIEVLEDTGLRQFSTDALLKELGSRGFSITLSET